MVYAAKRGSSDFALLRNDMQCEEGGQIVHWAESATLTKMDGAEASAKPDKPQWPAGQATFAKLLKIGVE